MLIPVKENIYKEGECIAVAGTALTEEEARARGVWEQIKPAAPKRETKPAAPSGKEAK